MHLLIFLIERKQENQEETTVAWLVMQQHYIKFSDLN